MPDLSQQYVPIPDAREFKAPMAAPKSAAIAPPTPDAMFGKMMASVQKQNPGADLNAQLNTPILTRLDETLRYTDPNIGYNPFDNNLEYKYADAHPIQTFRNNLVQAGARFLGAAAESIATIPIALSSIGSDKSLLETLHNNDMTNGISDWLDGLQNSLPTYTTEYEKEHPVLKYLTPWKLGSFAGALGSTVNNFGYTAGAIAGALVEDAIITAATGGAGLFPALAANGAQLTKAISRLGKVIVTAPQEITALVRSTARAADLVETGLQTTRGVAKLGEVGEAIGSAGNVARNEGDNIISQGVKNADEIAASVKANGIQGTINNAYNYYKIRDAVKYNLALLTSASAEGAFEAVDVRKRGLDELKKDYYDIYNHDATGEELKAMEKSSIGVANNTMMANIALLYLSNRINWGSLFKPTTNAITETISGIGKGIARNTLKTTVDEAGAITYSVLSKTPETAIGKILLNGEKFGKIASRSINESIEEGSQFIISESNIDYARAKFAAEQRGEVANYMKSFASGVDKTFNTNEGWDNMIGGFVGGIFGSGIMNKVQGGASEKQQLEHQVTLMNSARFNGTFENKIQEASVQSYLGQKYKAAIEQEDVFAAKNTKTQMLYNWVASGTRANSYDKRLNELDMVRGFEGAAFKNYWGVEDTEQNRQQANTFLDGIKTKADKIKKNVERIDYLTKNPYNAKKQPQDHEAYNSYKDELARSLYESGDYQDRIAKVSETLKKLTPNLNIQTAVNLTSIGGLRETLKNINKAALNVAAQIQNTEEGSDIQKELEAKYNALDGISRELQPLITDTTVTQDNFVKQSAFNGAKYVATLQKLYDLHNGISFEQNSFLDQQKRISDGNTLHIDGRVDTKTDHDQLAEALLNLQDIYKLSDANLNVQRYYNFLRKGVGQTDFTTKVKQMMEALQNISVEERKDLAKTPEEIENQLEEDLRTDNPAPVDAEDTNTAERETMRKAAKKTVNKEPLTQEEQDLADTKPIAFTHEVKLQQELKKQVDEKINNKQTKSTESKTAAEKAANKSEQTVHNLFGMFSANRDTMQNRSNLFNAIFNSGINGVFSKLKATFKLLENVQEGFTFIPGTKMFRKTFGENLTITHEGNDIGILRPQDSIYLDNAGKRSIFDLTKEEYADVTGNTETTYEDFMASIKAYRESYNKLKAEIAANPNKEFTYEDIAKYFDLSINLGSRDQQNTDPSKDVILKNANYKPDGRILISFIDTVDNKTGKSVKSTEPFIVNKAELTPEQLAKAEAFLAKQGKKISGDVNRYAIVFPINGEYLPVGVVYARNAESTETDRKSFFDLVKSVASGKLSSEEIDQAIETIAQKHFLANADRKVKQSFTNMVFTEDGDFVVNIFNAQYKVNKQIYIDKTKIQNTTDYAGLMNLVNNSLTEEAAKDPTFKKLSIVINENSLKRQIPTDESVEKLDDIADTIKLATGNPDIFQNYNINFTPKQGNAASGTTQGRVTTLPKDLQGAKPRYGYQDKKFQLNFISDIDKAAYITAQSKKSPRDADYLKFAMNATGLTEAEVRTLGQQVRDAIKAIAKDQEGDTIIDLEQVYKEKERVIITPAPAATVDPNQAKKDTITQEYEAKRREIITERNKNLTPNELKIKEALLKDPKLAYSISNLATTTGLTREDIAAYITNVNNFNEQITVLKNIQAQKIANLTNAVSNIFAKSKAGIVTIMQDLFNLPKDQATAVSEIYEANANAWAKRTGKAVADYYKNLGFASQLNTDTNGILKQPENAKFAKWFGESKIKNENGTPIKVYHGTGRDFDEFKISGEGNMGFHFGSPLAAQTILDYNHGSEGKIIDGYIRIENPITLTWEQFGVNSAEDILSPFLESDQIPQNIKDKLSQAAEKNRIDNEKFEVFEQLLKNELKALGFDGVIYPNNWEDVGENSYIIFDANQFKSSSNTEFSLTDNRYNYQIIGEQGVQNLEDASKILGNLDVAKQMQAKAMYSRGQIRTATGWELSGDNKWRYEIEDDIQFNEQAFKNLRFSVDTKLGDLLAPDSELLKVYPQLKDVLISKLEKSSSSLFNARDNVIGITKNKFIIDQNNTKQLTAESIESIKSTLLHEVQHAIQHIEGFTNGGNTAMFAEDSRAITQRIDSLKFLKQNAKKNRLTAKQIETLDNRIEELTTEARKTAYNKYRSVAGEVEARNVQERMNLSAAQRLERTLASTEDIDEESKIYLQGKVNVANSTDTKIQQAIDLVNSGVVKGYTADILKASINNPADFISLLNEVAQQANDPRSTKVTEELYGKELISLAKQISIDNNLLYQDAKGAYNTMTNVIYALTNPNVSTPLHEMAHSWEQNLTDAERIQVLNWANTFTWTRETSEKFAKGFELYLAEGNKTNNPELTSLFDKFAKWLTDVYNNLKTALGIALNDEMRGIYSTMINSDFVKIENKKSLIKEIYRRQNDLRSLSENDNTSIWFTPNVNSPERYGKNIFKAMLADGAKILEAKNSIEFIKDKNLLDEKLIMPKNYNSNEAANLTEEEFTNQYKTIGDLINNKENIYVLDFTQAIIEKYLKDNNEDGIYYSEEGFENNEPTTELQIVNKNVIIGWENIKGNARDAFDAAPYQLDPDVNIEQDYNTAHPKGFYNIVDNNHKRLEQSILFDYDTFEEAVIALNKINLANNFAERSSLQAAKNALWAAYVPLTAKDVKIKKVGKTTELYINGVKVSTISKSDTNGFFGNDLNADNLSFLGDTIEEAKEEIANQYNSAEYDKIATQTQGMTNTDVKSPLDTPLTDKTDFAAVSAVQKAVQNGYYEKQIANKVLTADQVKEILTSAGLSAAVVEGMVFKIENPNLIESLKEGVPTGINITYLRSSINAAIKDGRFETAITDGIISVEKATEILNYFGVPIAKFQATFDAVEAKAQEALASTVVTPEQQAAAEAALKIITANKAAIPAGMEGDLIKDLLEAEDNATVTQILLDNPEMVNAINTAAATAQATAVKDVIEPTVEEPEVVDTDKYVAYTEVVDGVKITKYGKVKEELGLITVIENEAGDEVDKLTDKLTPATKKDYEQTVTKTGIEEAKYKKGDKVVYGDEGKTYTITGAEQKARPVNKKTIRNGVASTEEVDGTTKEVFYTTKEGVLISETGITGKARKTAVEAKMEIKQEHVQRAAALNRIAQSFQRIFPQIKYDIGYFDFEAPARFYKGVVQVNVGYNDKRYTIDEINKINTTTGYFNQPYFSRDVVAHEFMHPFILALKISNNTLYNNLVKDLNTNNKDITDHVTDLISKGTYTEDNRNDEGLALYLGREMTKAFNKNGTINNDYVNARKNNLIRRFITWLKDAVNYLTGRFKPVTLEDFISRANSDFKNQTEAIRTNIYKVEALKDIYNKKYASDLKKFVRFFNTEYNLLGEDKFITKYGIDNEKEILDLQVDIDNYINQKASGRFIFETGINANSFVEVDQTNPDNITITLDETFSNNLSSPALLTAFANKIDEEHRDEFIKLVNDNFYKKMGADRDRESLKVNELYPMMNLRDLSDLIVSQFDEEGPQSEKSDFRVNNAIPKFTIDYTGEELGAIDELEAYMELEEPEAKKIRKRIMGKLGALKDTAERRLNSEVLKLNYNAIKKLDLDAESDVDFVLQYMQQASLSINLGWRTYNQMLQDLGTNKGNITKAALTRYNKELGVVRQLVSFYDEFSKYSRFEESIESKDFIKFQKSLASIELLKQSMQDAAIKLTVEWFTPYINQHNKFIKQSGTTDEKYQLTPEQLSEFFKYGTGKDTNFITYWLGANITSRDPINAVFANTVADMLSFNNIDIVSKAFDIGENFDKFIKTNGLTVSNTKQQEEYYKKHYLRQAEILSYKYNEAGEAVPVYIKKMAFHQEYFFDQYEKDLATEREKYKNPRSSAEADQFHDLLEQWKKDANYGKSAKYFNKDYASLNNDKYFKTLEKYYNDANVRYGNDALQFGIIPQKYSVNFLDKAKRFIADTKAGKTAQDKFNVTKDKITGALAGVKKDDRQYNLDGTIYRTINSNLTSAKEEQNISLDLHQSIIDFVTEGTNYGSLKETQYQAETLSMLLEGNVKFSVPARKFSQADFNAKITDPKKFKEAQDKLAELQDLKDAGDTYDVDLYDKLTKKVEKGIEEKNVWDNFLPRLKPAKTNYNNEMLLGQINDLYFGESTEEQKIGNISANKLAHYLSLYTSINSMAGNVIAGLSNVNIGNLQLFIEGQGGQYFNKKDVVKATADYIKNIPEFIKDLQSPIKSKDTQLSFILDAVQGEVNDEFGERVSGNIAQKMFRLNSLFLLTSLGEHQIQITGMKAMMLGRKIETEKDGFITLYDAYVKDANGRYNLRTDLKDFGKDELAKFIRDLHGVNRNLNGNYSDLNKTMLQRKWYGTLMLKFRKYLYPAFRSRWASEHTDYERNTRDVGYMRYFFGTYIVNGIKNLSHKGSFGFTTKRTYDAKTQTFKEEKYAPYETVAIRKAWFELAIYAGITILAAAAFGGGDDKKPLTPAEKFALLMVLRLRSDLGMYHVDIASEGKRQLKNPTASLNSVVALGDVITQMWHPFEIYEQKSGKHEAGDSKMAAKLSKLVPIYSKLNIDVDDKLGYFDLINRNIEGVSRKQSTN